MPTGIQLLDQHGRPLSGQRNGFALPPVLTTSAIYRGAYHTFLDEKYDEALRHNRDNGLAMRRDCWLMALVEERIRKVLGLKWSIEVDNPKDPRQKQVADGITKAIRMTPRLRGFFRQQLWAIFYGRYANQVKWRWKAADVDGKPNKLLTVARHTPVNGDKIGYQYQDEKTGEYTDTPYVRVTAGFTEDAIGPAEYLYSSAGKAVLLKGTWLDRFLIHTFNPTDADFLEGDMQGGIHGTGVRSVCYWNWYMRDEGWGVVFEQLDRIGLGLVCIKFDQGNVDAEKAADQLARNFSKRAVIKIPVPAGTLQSRTASGPYGIEIVDAPTAGIEIMQTLRKDLEDKIERYIVGQSMSGGKDKDNGEGLGGAGQSDYAADTQRDITVGDANDLEETATGTDEEPGLVSVIKRWSYPWADENKMGFPARFRFHVDEEDPGKQLEAVTKAVSLPGGLKVKADYVRGLIGAEKPGPDDETVGGEQPGAMPGMPGAAPEGGADGTEIPAGTESGDEPAAGGVAGAGADSNGTVGGLRGEDGSAVQGGDEGDGEEDGSGNESAAFLDYLNSLNGEAPSVQYARDPWELVLYAPEDWVTGTPTRGPNKGKQGWHNTRTKKWLFQSEHPGVGEAKQEEGKAQKKTASDAAKAAKQQAKEAKARQKAAPKPASAAKRKPQESVGDIVHLIESLKGKPSPEGAKKLAETLNSCTKATLVQLNKHFGLKASGVKPEVGKRIAEYALGDGPPVGGGHPVQPTLAGVAQALGIGEADARQRLGADAPQFEAMLARLSGQQPEPGASLGAAPAPPQPAEQNSKGAGDAASSGVPGGPSARPVPGQPAAAQPVASVRPAGSGVGVPVAPVLAAGQPEAARPPAAKSSARQQMEKHLLSTGFEQSDLDEMDDRDLADNYKVRQPQPAAHSPATQPAPVQHGGLASSAPTSPMRQQRIASAKTLGEKIHEASAVDVDVFDPLYGQPGTREAGIDHNEVLRLLDARYSDFKRTQASGGLNPSKYPADAKRIEESMLGVKDKAIRYAAGLRKLGKTKEADWYETHAVALVEEARRDLLGDAAPPAAPPASPAPAQKPAAPEQPKAAAPAPSSQRQPGKPPLGSAAMAAIQNKAAPVADRIQAAADADTEVFDALTDTPEWQALNVNGNNNEFMRYLDVAQKNYGQQAAAGDPEARVKLGKAAHQTRRTVSEAIAGLRKLAAAGVKVKGYTGPIDLAGAADFYEQHALPLADEAAKSVGASAVEPAQHQQAVSDAFRKLDTRGYNLVSLADIRDQLAAQGMDRAAQDAAIQQMRQAGKISLSGVEGRHAASNPEKHKREMDAAIREGNETLGNVAMRK